MASIRERLARAIEYRWYTSPGWLYLFYPLELLFSFFSKRRKQQQINARSDLPVSVPVVVIGNLTVGGTGKTPTIIAITKFLQSRGKKVGVVSRGYGRSGNGSMLVDSTVTPEQVGDEPFLIYSRTGCTVAVADDRVEGVRMLEDQGCDMILSDDGLQHYRMPRDIEIVLVDGSRGFGNGHLLPLGPLRESVERCTNVDWVLINGEARHYSLDKSEILTGGPASAEGRRMTGVQNIQLQPVDITSIATGKTLPIEALKDLQGGLPGGVEGESRELSAVAAIGNPQRFFSTLKTMGLEFKEHIWPDHHAFVASDFDAFDDQAVIMTEKDAVKCTAFAKPNWYQLNVQMQLDDVWLDAFWERLGQISK